MEFIFVLYVAFFAVLQSTCSSSSLQVQVQSSHQQGAAYEVQQLSMPILPRKLMKNTEKTSLKGNAAKDAIPMTNNQQPVGDEDNSGNQKEQQVVTWREWSKPVDTSEIFTMDYSHVRRRRPIHNQSLPP